MQATLNWYHWGLIAVLTLNSVGRIPESAFRFVGTAVTVIALVWLSTMFVRGLQGVVSGGYDQSPHSWQM